MSALTEVSRPVSSSIVIRAGGDRWRRKARLLYEYARREMRDAEDQRRQFYPDTWATHIQRTIPLTWRMAREMSTLYLRSPLREWKGATDTQRETIEQVYAEKKVNRKLRQAHEHLSVVQNATVWVWLTASGWKLINPPVHELWVTPGSVVGDDVEDVLEWRLRLPVVSDPTASTAPTAVALITPAIAIWESGPDGWAGTGIWREDGSNPFGRIPVVLLRGSDPGPGEFWAPVPEDMLDSQRAANHDATDLGTIARLQGYAQAVAKGLTAQQAREIEVGPQKTVGVPPDGDFTYASPAPSIEQYLSQSESYLKLTIACNGMNPATIMKSAGITALAKIIEIMDREVERRRAVDEFAAAENALYELVRLADNATSGGLGRLPVGVTVTVSYREPVQPADPTSQAQADSQNIDLGIESAATILADREAISVADAEERVRANREFTTSLMSSETPPADTTPADSATTDSATTDTPSPDAQPVAPAPAAPVADVAKTALNGAQVTALQGLLTELAAGRQPVASVREAILLSFPDFDEARVDRMLAPYATFVAPSSAPPAAPQPPQPAQVP